MTNRLFTVLVAVAFVQDVRSVAASECDFSDSSVLARQWIAGSVRPYNEAIVSSEVSGNTEPRSGPRINAR